MEIDVSRLLQAALHSGASEVDLNAKLEEACRQLYPEHNADALRSSRQMLDRATEQMGCSRLEAARRLAQGKAVVRAGSMRVNSLDELPPELRARAERMMASGESSSAETYRTSYSAGGPRQFPSGGQALGFPGQPPMRGRSSSQWLWPVRVGFLMAALAAAAWIVSWILR